MPEFKTTKNGYDPKEVENYLKKLKFEYEKSLGGQKDRIFELKAEVKALEEKLAELGKRDKLISRALVNAVSKAEEIEQAAKMKYDLELKSLKLFHMKWLSYYNKILEKYPLDDTLMNAARFNEQLEIILAEGGLGEASATQKLIKPAAQAPVQPSAKGATPTKTLAERQYESESRRISALNAKKGINLKAVSDALGDTENDSYEKVLATFGKKFNPMEKIESYYANTKTPAKPAFDIEEALNPKESLEDIMKSLGLLEE